MWKSDIAIAVQALDFLAGRKATLPQQQISRPIHKLAQAPWRCPDGEKARTSADETAPPAEEPPPIS